MFHLLEKNVQRAFHDLRRWDRRVPPLLGILLGAPAGEQQDVHVPQAGACAAKMPSRIIENRCAAIESDMTWSMVLVPKTAISPLILSSARRMAPISISGDPCVRTTNAPPRATSGMNWSGTCEGDI